MSYRKGAMGLLLLTLCLLAACAAPSPTPTPVAAPTPTPTSTPAPTPTPIPTPVPTPEEPTELWGFPIDDTHDAFEVPTGGKLGTVLVTVEKEEGVDYDFHLDLSVWSADDLTEPFQTMEVEESSVFHWNDVVDANFDGYMDFCYMFAMGNQPGYWHYWIWDEAQGLFVAEPAFDAISWPQFDVQTETISGWARSSCCSGVHTYHRWEDGELVCIRRIELHYPERNEDGTYNQLATVEDRVDGELVEVFREYCTNAIDNGEYPFEDVWDWVYDPDYHGEEDG